MNASLSDSRASALRCHPAWPLGVLPVCCNETSRCLALSLSLLPPVSRRARYLTALCPVFPSVKGKHDYEGSMGWHELHGAQCCGSCDHYHLPSPHLPPSLPCSLLSSSELVQSLMGPWAGLLVRSKRVKVKPGFAPGVQRWQMLKESAALRAQTLNTQIKRTGPKSWIPVCHGQGATAPCPIGDGF